MPVKFEDVKLGDTLICRGEAFGCMSVNKEYVVGQSDRGNLCLNCSSGFHLLREEVDPHGMLPDFDLKSV